MGIRIERIEESKSPIVIMGGHCFSDEFTFNAPFSAPGVKLTVNGTVVLLSQEEVVVLATELMNVMVDG